MKAEAKDKSTKERHLEEKKAKGGGVDLRKSTSVDKSSELNKNIYEPESVIVVDEDDDNADELDEVQVDAQVDKKPKKIF